MSIALNIAEGSGSGSDKEFARFCSISFRSIYEVMTGVEIAIQLNYGNKDDNTIILKEADELAAMISSFIKVLKADS